MLTLSTFPCSNSKTEIPEHYVKPVQSQQKTIPECRYWWLWTDFNIAPMLLLLLNMQMTTGKTNWLPHPHYPDILWLICKDHLKRYKQNWQQRCFQVFYGITLRIYQILLKHTHKVVFLRQWHFFRNLKNNFQRTWMRLLLRLLKVP